MISFIKNVFSKSRLTVLCSVPCIVFLSFCSNYSEDNTPTTGKLNVCYDEGLALHVKNQAATFESQYPSANLKLVQVSENKAVQALYKDSCEAIVISRLLTDVEKKAFESKGFFPKYSAVAKTGVALITNIQTQVNQLSFEQIIQLLQKPFLFKDSAGKEIKLNVLFDKNNSAVLHYMMDSVLKGSKLSENCNILHSSIESINYVAKNKNTIAFIDFAWLSDADDSISKANKNSIKFISITKPSSTAYELPSQSSFKRGTYPFIRTVYIFRKTGDFTLAKGFESFVASQKGQLTFLKQGLLPTRPPERALEIKME